LYLLTFKKSTLNHGTNMAIKWFGKKHAKNEKEKSVQPVQTSDTRAEDTANDAQIVAVESAPIEADLPAQSTSPPQTETSPKIRGLFSRLKKGLAKTREILTTDIDALFSSKSEVDDDMLEQLEELLITSDIGVQTAMSLMQTIQKRTTKVKDPAELKPILKQEILSLLSDASPGSVLYGTTKPHVIMVVGVNGVGKTTTIGKLAAHLTGKNQSVLIAAADTFRAAAIEQLSIWADRAGAELVKHKENSDPAAVAFDAIEAAMARGIDTVFVDTAGRLHTKVNLMEELKKIKRTIAKKIPDAPHEILLVLDATTGQNALAQAKMFHEALDLTGLALTKLDGTAKGGIVISICQSMQIPLHFIGVGESIEDLQPFDPEKFAEALF
jgi:fused signal recognition particle receptor